MRGRAPRRSLRAPATLLALAGCLLSGVAGAPGQGAGSRRVRGAAEVRAGRKTVSYEGVSFSYDDSLASDVKAETMPASPLKDPTAKPDGIAPEHVAFKLLGPYATRNADSYFHPEIHIYPIEDYKRAYAVAPDYAAGVGDVVRTLKRALARRPMTFKDEAPYIDFIDAHQAFQAHVHYLNFRGGKGLAFLTEYVFEPTVISNRGLTYIFQGLTDDGKFYVSATFPVAAPALPAEDTPELAQRYRLYEKVCVTCPQDGPYNRAYLKTISRMLERTPPRQFRPRLTAFDALLSSMSVRTVESGKRRPARSD